MLLNSEQDPSTLNKPNTFKVGEIKFLKIKTIGTIN